MQIFYLPSFLRSYKKCSLEIKTVFKRREDVFRLNPFDPRLKTHKLHGTLQNNWAFSINFDWRVIFKFEPTGEDATFYDIGTHSIYE